MQWTWLQCMHTPVWVHTGKQLIYTCIYKLLMSGTAHHTVPIVHVRTTANCYPTVSQVYFLGTVGTDANTRNSNFIQKGLPLICLENVMVLALSNSVGVSRTFTRVSCSLAKVRLTPTLLPLILYLSKKQRNKRKCHYATSVLIM